MLFFIRLVSVKSEIGFCIIYINSCYITFSKIIHKMYQLYLISISNNNRLKIIVRHV